METEPKFEVPTAVHHEGTIPPTQKHALATGHISTESYHVHFPVRAPEVLVPHEIKPSLLRNSSINSFSERDSSCDTSPTHSVHSACSEDVIGIDFHPNLAPHEREVAISFDVISHVAEGVGDYLFFQMQRCRLPPMPSRFDALTEPKISLSDYFHRIRQYSLATPETILCAVVLIRRLTKASGLTLNNLNAHRLVVTAIMMFAKFYDDEIDSNARWARIAGVKKVEINNLEVEFLNLLQFDLRVTPEEFHEIVFAIDNHLSKPHSSHEDATTEKEGTDSACDQPITPRRSGIQWAFHVKKGELKRTKSHAENPHRVDRHSSHKSIMSFFHHTEHAHLNSFRPCSPSTATLSQPPTPGFSHSPAPRTQSSASNNDSPQSQSSRRSSSRFPHPPSLQHITAMLHGASPFNRNSSSKSSQKYSSNPQA